MAHNLLEPPPAFFFLLAYCIAAADNLPRNSSPATTPLRPDAIPWPATTSRECEGHQLMSSPREAALNSNSPIDELADSVDDEAAIISQTNIFITNIH